MPKKKSHIIVYRVPVLCLDSRWQTKFKFLWDAWAAANEGYTGYVDIWDTIPWQQVVLDDGMPHDFNYAAMAQYLPSYGGSGDYEHIFDPCVASGLQETYCHNCLGLVGDIIALLETDGIADEIIKATYSIEGAGTMKTVPLRDLFFRNFDPANICCPIVFSRPMTYSKGGPGHIGDNNQQAFFVRAVDSCDGTEGLRVTLAPETYRNEFRADAIHFLRTVPADEIIPLLAPAALASPLSRGTELERSESSGGLSSARLVVYAIACGSVPRISINGTWFVVSPTYFPPYGDPYGYCFRGHKHTVGTIAECGLRIGAGEANDFIVEHIAPLSDEIGAQVIFAIEYDEIIIEPTHGRKHMAGLTHDQRRAFVRKMIEFTNEFKADIIAAGYDPTPRIAELTTLNNTQEHAEAEQNHAFVIAKQKTEASVAALEIAYKNASGLVELIIGFLGKGTAVAERLKNIRDLMNIEKPKDGGTTPP